MDRPVVLLTCFYIAGSVMGRYLSPVQAVVSAAFITVLLFGVFFICKKGMERKNVVRGLLFALPFVFLGIITVNAQKPSPFEKLDGKNVSVSGVVSDVYETDYGMRIVTVRVSEISDGKKVIKYNKKISARTYEVMPLYPGQAVNVTGAAEKPDFLRNPGGFSESVYMRTRGIGGKVKATRIEAGKMEKIGLYTVGQTREKISGAFYRALPPDMAGLILAMVLGDRSGLTDEISDSFSKAGISYILSVSGLHLSLAAFMIFELMRFIGLRIRGRAAATILIIWSYCFFTGLPVSAVRAGIMITVIMLGYIFRRSPDVFSSAAFAALLILLKQPFFLWDAGFLFSFSAVLGMSVLSPAIRAKLRFLDFGGVKLSDYIASTLSATAATLPVCAWFFYSVSVVGVLVNIFIAPFSGLLVGAGIAFAALSAFFVSGILSSVIFTLLKYFVTISEIFGNLPFSHIVTGRPSLHNIVLYYAAVYIVWLHIKARSKCQDNPAPVKEPRLKQAAFLLFIAFFAINIRKALPDNKLEIAFLDVGQGDASVLHLPGNIDIMIDAGGNILQDIGKNTGTRIVFPYLKYRGITKLDAVFLTHPDMDHAAGVIEIMGLVKVNRLFISDVLMENEVLDEVLKTAERESVPVTRIKSGYRAEIGNVRIECVYPVYSVTPKDINNSSLTLKIIHGENSFLFTGDIEESDEEKILLSGADIKSRVLKVPHHGSNTSSTPGFVQAVSPEYALAGTSKSNIYGHPAPEVKETYARFGAILYVTAEDGAILLKSDGVKTDISTMREESERWSN